MKTVRQQSYCSVTFYPHDQYSEEEKRARPALLTSNPRDIVSCTTHKEIGQAAGGFTLTLVPRQQYLTALRANDWVEIYMDGRNGEEDAPVMVGIIDRVARRRVVSGQKGETRTVIVITGRDYGKVFLSTQITVDPVLGALIDQVGFDNDVVLSKSSDLDTPTLPPGEVVRNLLVRYHDNRIQCVPPSALLSKLVGRAEAAYLKSTREGTASLVPAFEFKSGLLRVIYPTEGRVIVGANMNFGGTLWSSMEQFVNPLLNEMWVDTVEGVPAFFVEERPFTHEAFSHLEGASVLASDCTQEEFGFSDSDVHNWIRVYPDVGWLPSEMVDVAGAGFADRFSWARSGIRKLEPTTLAFADFTKSILTETLGAWSERLTEWYAKNDTYLDGSFSMRLRTDIRVGQRLDYSNAREAEFYSFYVESVTHNYAYPGTATTSVTVTRGVARDPATGTFEALKDVEALRFNGVTELRQLQLSPIFDDGVTDSEGIA